MEFAGPARSPLTGVEKLCVVKTTCYLVYSETRFLEKMSLDHRDHREHPSIIDDWISTYSR